MNFIIKNKKNNQGGFLTLTMVLLVCGAVLIISIGIFLRSISQVNQSGDSENALKAWSTVNACSEYALGKLAPDWSYFGDESLNVGNQTCYIYPVTASGTSRFIQAVSTVSGFTKKVLIEVATNTPSIVINSWSMVANFEGEGNSSGSSICVATGGTITESGGYTIHTFTNVGANIFEVTSGSCDAEVLVVAGGGQGGSALAGGGGGGGLISTTTSITSSSSPYTVTVGSGGSGGGTFQTGGSGSNSSFDSIIAIGGGGGGGNAAPGNGGSGGGGGYNSGNGGSGIAGQGHKGGNGRGSGGGGAGAVGGNSAYPSGAAGGAGLSYSISGTSTYYAGGGGGASEGGSPAGLGGNGGGGAGEVADQGNGGPGTANTGGGGGGRGGAHGGWNGGSGIVIVRYPTSGNIVAAAHEISTCEELQAIKDDLSSNFILTNDIDCSDTVNWNGGLGFLPIGGYIGGDPIYAFSYKGIFNGNNHTISNLYINRGSSGALGLFAHIAGSVGNLGLIDANITGRQTVGILAGGLTPGGVICNSYSTGNTTATLSYAGGLVASNHGTIKNSYSTANVGSGFYIGGLVASNQPSGVVSNSYSTGNVTTSYVPGGILGNVSGAGGLFGTSFALNPSSYWDVDTSGRPNMCGDANSWGYCTDANGKTTAQMQSSTPFSGWDTNIWTFTQGQYPKLKPQNNCLVAS